MVIIVGVVLIVVELRISICFDYDYDNRFADNDWFVKVSFRMGASN
jgi:hypothetical protein